MLNKERKPWRGIKKIKRHKRSIMEQTTKSNTGLEPMDYDEQNDWAKAIDDYFKDNNVMIPHINKKDLKNNNGKVAPEVGAYDTIKEWADAVITWWKDFDITTIAAGK